MDRESTSPGGSRIIRYPERTAVGADSLHSGGYLKEIEDHLAGFFGRNDFVFHKIVSDAVHIDVLEFAPTPKRDFWTFVTCGMSDKPMKLPPQFAGNEALSRAELVLSLPSGWVAGDGRGGYDRTSVDRPERWWPIQWLIYLARFAPKYDTWLWADHSVPNGAPAKPLGLATSMCGWVLGAPRTWPAAAQVMTSPPIIFHAIFPVYYEEMKFKLNKGSGALFDLFDRNGVTEILNPVRPRVVR